MRTWTHDRDGLPLFVREWGAGERDLAPVLCLHGFLDQSSSFAALAAGRRGRWLAYDQRGFGRSGRVEAAGWYHFADHVADLDAMVEEVCDDDHPNVDLVGHSMGGTVALLYAAARPERVRRLVVLDGLGPLHGPDDSLVVRLRRFLHGQRDPPTNRPLASLEAVAQRLAARRDLPEDDLQSLAQEAAAPLPDGAWGWRFDPRHRVRAPTTLYEPLLQPFLDAVRAPALVVWAQDGFYPEDVRAQRVARLARCRVVTLPGGHMSPLDEGAHTGSLVEAFLREAGP